MQVMGSCPLQQHSEYFIKRFIAAMFFRVVVCNKKFLKIIAATNFLSLSTDLIKILVICKITWRYRLLTKQGQSMAGLHDSSLKVLL